MTDKENANTYEGSVEKIKTPENVVIVNPDKPLYGVEYLCEYLSELPELFPDGQGLDSSLSRAKQK
ncbi:MAG TPA: hypothetical protein PLX88_00870 [Syntrophorhabdaceae bacterium]|jgi:hypothetical protein|nr:hypothetical protein [Syntrophorhabdaceae bacterium]MDI9561004.1 hypothetical protein [Pseudomonadota bacterium]OQC47357.1 MAG: hypothetical protein BWX58_01580 [Deltaproteobacteria bacterium ADurb.Bin026]MBP8697679.1 hypothetical protein [Syntrophorhabdaceae bacterium]MBV6506749.1 hypothetical protein [Syntrophorhabdaceae bacterium]